MTIIAAHWGGGLPFYALMPEVRDALQNVWFDTAAGHLLYDRRSIDASSISSASSGCCGAATSR